MTFDFSIKLIFWLSVAALGYTYVGYPILLALLSRLRNRPVHSDPTSTPSVSVIITAYNEERDLAAKLENTLALDYPKDKLEIIVASDCSSDATDEIAKSFAPKGVRLHRQTERLGKTAAQNAAVEIANGDVILFSDATTLYQPDVLRLMVPNFADPTVGCVAGQLIYVDPLKTGVGQGARSYWNYEVFLKRHESSLCSLIGVSGCLYAVRRSAYVPLYHEACSDFIIATKMMEQGLRAVYEPQAICTEETNTNARKELRMRVRVIAQTYTDLWRHRGMMNPYRSGFYAVQLFSHKVMRYLVPAWLVILFVTSLLLAPRSLFFKVILLAQIVSYVAAGLGWLLESAGVGIGPLALPHYFMLANIAAVVAFYKFLRGERYAYWQPIREATLAPEITSEEAADSMSLADDEESDAVAVSVVIPAYNAAGFISEALNSVFAQTFSDYEVIVVNDGSPDTKELEKTLGPYQGRIVYLRQDNRGPSGARNTAIRLARGKYIAMLDSDDSWMPEYLQQQMAMLKADSTLKMVYSDALLFGESELAGRTFMQCAPSRGPVTFESLLRYDSSIITSCSVVERSALISAGWFDEKFIRCEDFDLWLRLAHQGSRISYQTKVLARHRTHGHSLAADAVKMVESQIEVLQKTKNNLQLSEAQHKLVEQQLANCHAQIDLEQGKRHFVDHDYPQAAQYLQRANGFYNSRKLRFVVWCLLSAPRALHSLYSLRQNLGRTGSAGTAAQK